jgi:hypothetical protein
MRGLSPRLKGRRPRPRQQILLGLVLRHPHNDGSVAAGRPMNFEATLVRTLSILALALVGALRAWLVYGGPPKS